MKNQAAKNNLINVSAGKTASQSSFSKWSRPNESAEALKPKCKRMFAFHTGLDDKPWWMVDLGDIYPIHSIVVGNRSDKFFEKARTLRVEVSRDGKSWDTVHSGFMIWRFEHTFLLCNEIIGRYVRLSLDEKQYLHLTKVEVWSSRSPLTVVCNRSDGFGCRLEALIRGKYLAKVLNADLKVRWHDQVVGKATKLASTKVLDGNLVLGHSVEPANDVFSKAFCESSITPGAMKMESKLSEVKNLTAKRLHDTEVQDEPGILYAPGGFKSISLNPFLAPNTSYGYSHAFWEIEFSPKMKAAIDAALQIPLRERKAALHLRSGDIVFGDYRKQGRRFMRKAVPLPLALMGLKRLIEDGYQVMLFGEDLKALKILKEKVPDILLATDQNTAGLSGAAGALFDIVLMSRMDTIWAGDSGFARIANEISRDGTFRDLHKLFDVSEKISFFRSEIPKLKSQFHPLQTAFALWSLYCMSEDLSVEESIKSLDELNEIDPENPVYLIQKACVLLTAGKYQQAERVLGDFLYVDWKVGTAWGDTEASKCIMAGSNGVLHLRTILGPIENSEDVDEYPNVLLFLAMIAAGKHNFERSHDLLEQAVRIKGHNELIDQIMKKTDNSMLVDQVEVERTRSRYVEALKRVLQGSN